VSTSTPGEAGAASLLSAEEYLRVPYILVMWAVVGEGGTWRRHAELPELPDCVIEADSTRDAIERLDELRVWVILDRLARGEPVPVPRPPLRA